MLSRQLTIPWLAIAAFLFVVSSTGVARALPNEEDDARIKQRIETRLMGQVTLHIESLGLDVKEGTVHITGLVPSLGERLRTERVVGGIVGVRGILNELAVKPTDRSEIAISQEVQRSLESRTRFRKNPVQVTVSGTEVTLSGTVDRGLDRIDAEEISAEAAGVTRVQNNLQVRTEGHVPPETIRSRVTSILTNPLTFGVIRRLEVDVEDSTVTLKGVATRDADRLQAERLALSVPGVSGVINLIQVAEGA